LCGTYGVDQILAVRRSKSKLTLFKVSKKLSWEGFRGGFFTQHIEKNPFRPLATFPKEGFSLVFDHFLQEI
jgi:hypothetical protein